MLSYVKTLRTTFFAESDPMRNVLYCFFFGLCQSNVGIGQGALYPIIQQAQVLAR